MIIIQSVTSLLVIIPTITYAQSTPTESTIDLHSVDLLCENRLSANLISNVLTHSLDTLIGLFILQTGIALGFIGFYTLGLSYLDDMSLEHNSPALIGM